MSVGRLARPALGLLDPERAHRITLWGLRHGLAPREAGRDDARLRVRLWGREFPNPVGLAAGFDKNAEAPGPLLGLGFGFIEVGTVTPRAQPGNPRPRVFRLPEDGAVINRLGFNNRGAAAVRAALARWREGGGRGIVGVNLGKNRDTADAAADYAEGARLLGPDADYLVINVSSPNTPGLRALQERGELERLVGAVRAALGSESRPPALLVKVAPDLIDEELEGIARTALDQGLDGLIATNTTILRPAELAGRQRGQSGGLSGRPLFAPSTEVLAQLHRLTEGRVPLVGVGGVASGADAYAKIRAGASLVQLYTALVYHGPDLVRRIKVDLAELLSRDGFADVGAAVGADHRVPGLANRPAAPHM